MNDNRHAFILKNLKYYGNNDGKHEEKRGDWTHRPMRYMAPSTLFFKQGVKFQISSE